MRKILCIAHRGASAYRPENTIRAFEKAIEQGADCIEIDVQRTADNELVVYHDLCFRDGRLVRDHNLSEVQCEGRKRGIDVPKLDEVFYCLGSRIKLNIEIKTPGVVDLLRAKFKYYDFSKIICSSFIHSVIIELKYKMPGVSRAPIVASRVINPIKLLDETKSGIIVQNHEFVDAAYVRLLHKKNKLIFVYTVNNESKMVRMIDYKVDGIFTDYPDVLRQVIGRMEHPKPAIAAFQ
jgi:glycerophosphoryl diester phosphodiesterase